MPWTPATPAAEQWRDDDDILTEDGQPLVLASGEAISAERTKRAWTPTGPSPKTWS
ncbi:hypothetical protein ACO2Q0_03025 [Phenylobacterium sp. VNQ135]|uniref:hypothetical protein n=1 Tax=Phenylobacterium sp. VNQ135 TaxID=3400922 RepID=UPI003C02181D